MGGTSIVCDAKYTAAGKVPAFVEIDVSQPMSVNQRKIEKYKRFKELTSQPFYLIWVTQIESRRVSLKESMKGLQGEVFTLKDIM